MHPSQVFETVVVDQDGGAGVRFTYVPTGAISRESPWEPFESVMDELEMLDRTAIPIGWLPPALIALLRSDMGVTDPEELRRLWDFEHPFEGLLQDPQVEFAYYLAYADLIPHRNSPLDVRSLASLAVTSAPGGLGGLIGFAAVGSGPLLLVTVPGGIVLAMAATGAGRAIGDALDHHIRRWLRVPQREHSSGDPMV